MSGGAFIALQILKKSTDSLRNRETPVGGYHKPSKLDMFFAWAGLVVSFSLLAIIVIAFIYYVIIK